MVWSRTNQQHFWEWGQGQKHFKLDTYTTTECFKTPRGKQDPMFRVKTIINPTRERKISKRPKSDGQGSPFLLSNGKGLLAPNLVRQSQNKRIGTLSSTFQHHYYAAGPYDEYPPLVSLSTSLFPFPASPRTDSGDPQKNNPNH